MCGVYTSLFIKSWHKYIEYLINRFKEVREGLSKKTKFPTDIIIAIEEEERLLIGLNIVHNVI